RPHYRLPECYRPKASANQLGWNFSEVGFKCQIRLACRVLRPSQMENEDSRRKSECFWKNVKTPGASCHVSGKKCVLVAPVVVFSEKNNDGDVEICGSRCIQRCLRGYRRIPAAQSRSDAAVSGRRRTVGDLPRQTTGTGPHGPGFRGTRVPGLPDLRCSGGPRLYTCSLRFVRARAPGAFFLPAARLVPFLWRKTHERLRMQARQGAAIKKWRRRPRISSTTSSRLSLSGSGCFRFHLRCATAWPTTPVC